MTHLLPVSFRKSAIKLLQTMDNEPASFCPERTCPEQGRGSRRTVNRKYIVFFLIPWCPGLLHPDTLIPWYPDTLILWYPMLLFVSSVPFCGQTKSAQSVYPVRNVPSLFLTGRNLWLFFFVPSRLRGGKNCSNFQVFSNISHNFSNIFKRFRTFSNIFKRF